jgi:hypothetical protein
MVLEETGESDLLSKLKEHQLEDEDGGHLGQRSRPATGRWSERLRAVNGQ